ncbi:hypothetical protein [Parerythrobacter jejuensis]|nr:hypothetical protein [Parerythrobacter jejuensis]
MRGMRVGMVIALVLLLVFGWAWWDGGEQSLRPIEQEIAIPEGTL